MYSLRNKRNKREKGDEKESLLLLQHSPTLFSFFSFFRKGYPVRRKGSVTETKDLFFVSLLYVIFFRFFRTPFETFFRKAPTPFSYRPAPVLPCSQWSAGTGNTAGGLHQPGLRSRLDGRFRSIAEQGRKRA
jgi:hypothetical protein